MALLLTQRMYIFSAFPSLLLRKVEQCPCCARSLYVYAYGGVQFLNFEQCDFEARFIRTKRLF